MKQPIRFFALAAVLAALPLCTLGAQPAARSLECLVVMEEGASSEGNALFLRYMALQPEALRGYAPVSFTISKEGSFTFKGSGDFGFSAGTKRLLERQGNLALYSIPVELRAPPAPKAKKKVKVSFPLSDLAGKNGTLQPGMRAIELAARSAGWKAGLAWIIALDQSKPGQLSATVGFAK